MTISYSGAAAFTARIHLNLASIYAALGATLPMRAISDDTDGVAKPTTPLGQQHHTRGCPRRCLFSTSVEFAVVTYPVTCAATENSDVSPLALVAVTVM